MFEKGFGYCNVEQLLSCDPTQSVFRVASISKLITGVLTLKLASEGKIDLDDSIYKHLKDFPKKRIDGREVDITIRQLLNHTSGIRDYLPVGSTLTGEERTAEIAKNSQRNDEFVSLSESIKFFKGRFKERASIPKRIKYVSDHPTWTVLCVVGLIES